ncbi:MAG: S8 family serine peptidase, partial [Elusimicrobiota bacterium]
MPKNLTITLRVCKKIIFISAACFTLFPFNSSALNSNLKPGIDYVPGELIVKMRAARGSSRAGAMRAIGARPNMSVRNEIPGAGLFVVKSDQSKLAEDIARLSSSADIESVSLNYLYYPATTDTYYSSEWHLPKISAPTGWLYTTGLAAVRIAVIDNGFQLDHPDLVNRFSSVYKYNAATKGADGINAACDHGTQVSGVLGAQANNTIGMAGLALGNEMVPIQVRADSGCTMTSERIIQGIYYSTDSARGIKVINMSLGGSNYDQNLQDAVDEAWVKGLVVVAAAGNSIIKAYPAAMEHVVAVAATDTLDRRSAFSSYGPWVDLAAPGESMVVTMAGGSYGSAAGTSFSAPLVSGLAGLIWSKTGNSGLTNAQVI